MPVIVKRRPTGNMPQLCNLTFGRKTWSLTMPFNTVRRTMWGGMRQLLRAFAPASRIRGDICFLLIIKFCGSNSRFSEKEVKTGNVKMGKNDKKW